MSARYDEPNRAARAANTVIRWLAELAISITGTRALVVRGRKSGKRRGVVINLLTVGGVGYLASPRGNTGGWATPERPVPSNSDGARGADRSASLRSLMTPSPNCCGNTFPGGIGRSTITLPA